MDFFFMFFFIFCMVFIFLLVFIHCSKVFIDFYIVFIVFFSEVFIDFLRRKRQCSDTIVLNQGLHRVHTWFCVMPHM